MKQNLVKKEHTKPVVLAGPIPLEDISRKYNKIYWVCGIGGALFGMGGGALGMVVGCLFFCLLGKAVKNILMAGPVRRLSLTEYKLFKPITVEDALIELVQTEDSFLINHLGDSIEIVNKFAEYRIIINNDNLTFRVIVNFTTLGLLFNKRLYAKLYKRAIQDIGPIAYAVQLASK